MDTRDELDRLLARGRLSAPRRERILENVQKKVRPSKSRAMTLVLIAGPVAMAAALALVLRQAPRHAGYTAKGASDSSAELVCSGGEISACPRGSKLILRFDALKTPVFVHAYAEPIEAGGERVWYFPTGASTPPRIEPGPTARTLDKGIIVGNEHRSGGYRVHIVLGSVPLSREESLRGDGPSIVASDTFDLTVVD